MERRRKNGTVVKERQLQTKSADDLAEKQREPNNVRKIRESLLLSKAELARKAGLSALTIDRVESGHSCRMDTKRKIILALGMRLSDKDKVFGSRGETADDPDRDG